MSEQAHRPFTAAEMDAIRKLQRDEDSFRQRFFAMLARHAARLPFAEDIVAAWFCTRDPQTSPRVRYILMAALGYFVLPIDAIPDFLPLIGFTDDAAVIAAALATVAGAITPSHRMKAQDFLQKSG
jgi:uncharacterized membrane protein YkvA (DUF1232 family)